MRPFGKMLAAMALVFAGAAAADTLELKDGRVLQGRYLGGTQAQVRFEVNGELQTFSVTQIVAITFTGPAGSAGAAMAPASVASTAAGQPAGTADPGGSTVTIPAGTPILVRMIDGVDSSKNHVGDNFHASLETDLLVGDRVVARKGTDVYGRLAGAKEAGPMR